MLFTFPSRYLFTIGCQGYLALEGGPPSFPQDSSCPVVLKVIAGALSLSPTGLSPSMVSLSRELQLERRFITPCPDLDQGCHALQPLKGISSKTPLPLRFGLFPFRSPLLGESRLISFPRGTKMFQFPRFPHPSLCVRLGVSEFYSEGFPHSGILGLS